MNEETRFSQIRIYNNATQSLTHNTHEVQAKKATAFNLL